MSFVGIDKYNVHTLTTQLEQNIVSFIDDGLLKIGAFGNVDSTFSNIYGSNMHVLRPSSDVHNINYTLWHTPRENWVYEEVTGNYTPIAFSGITVDGSFYPAPTGNETIGYTVNYKEGTVSFDSPVSPSSTVTASYSYKLFNVEVANNSRIWKTIQTNSFKGSDFNNSTFASGDYNVPPEHRTQLPAIIVESVNRSVNRPFRLGDTSLLSIQSVLVHTISEHKADCDKINDILNRQQGRYIDLYDLNKLVESGTYPLNFDGSVNTGMLEYDEILDNRDYIFMSSRFNRVTVSEMKFYGIDLYGSTVQVDNELILNKDGV
jgi:hypothetical protein